MEKKRRALWLWDESIENDRDEIRRLCDFCFKESIALIFYAVSNLDKPRYEKISDFLSVMRREGIEVHALIGDSRWAMPGFQKQALSLVEEILRFNAVAGDERSFSGIQDDSEFYTLAMWTLDPFRLTEDYVSMIGKMRSLAGIEFKLGAAVPPWFSTRYVPGHEERGTIGERLFEFLDYVAVMSYRDRADGANGSIEISKPYIDLAGRMGKAVYIGQETQPDLVPESISLYGKSLRYIEEQFEMIDRYFSMDSGYAGIAIHHYRSYRRITEGSG